MEFMQTISVELSTWPDNINIDQRDLREAIASVLYYNGTLSEKEACMIIGSGRRYFEENVLPKFNLSMVGGTRDDVDIEIQGL